MSQAHETPPTSYALALKDCWNFLDDYYYYFDGKDETAKRRFEQLYERLRSLAFP